jgi:hypothetical protein
VKVESKIALLTGVLLLSGCLRTLPPFTDGGSPNNSSDLDAGTDAGSSCSIEISDAVSGTTLANLSGCTLGGGFSPNFHAGYGAGLESVDANELADAGIASLQFEADLGAPILVAADGGGPWFFDFRSITSIEGNLQFANGDSYQVLKAPDGGAIGDFAMTWSSETVSSHGIDTEALDVTGEAAVTFEPDVDGGAPVLMRIWFN